MSSNTSSPGPLVARSRDMSRLNAFLDAASVDDPRLRRAKPAPAPRQANARQVPHRRPPAPPPPPPPKRPPTPPILPAHELKLLIEEILSAQQTEEECPCEENPVRQQQPQQPPNQKDELLDLQNELVAKDFEWEEEFASLGAKQRTARPQNRMFECRICLEMVPVSSAVGMEGCDHELCEECMNKYVTSRILEERYPITCPVCQVEGRVGGVIGEEIVQSLGLEEELLRAYAELQVLQFSVRVECRRCNRKSYLDRGEHDAAATITCPLPGCCFEWCKTCQQEVDPNLPVAHSCDGTNELEALIVAQGWKRCPKCQIPVERIAGCNRIYCEMPGCGTRFCYACGGMGHTC